MQYMFKLLPNINHTNNPQTEKFFLTSKVFLKKEISITILVSLSSTITLFGEVSKFYFAISQKKRKIHIKWNLQNCLQQAA